MENKNELNREIWLKELENQLWDMGYLEPITDENLIEFNSWYDSGKSIVDAANDFLEI